MITINGSIGGGQLLRTALGLSAITLQPFKITNIREKRSNPGLKPQHLECVNAMQRLCNAEVEGAKLHAKEIIFKPDRIVDNHLKIKIPTAGSIPLLLQCLFLPGIKTKLKIKVEGGATFGLMSPTLDYAQSVFGGFLKRHGYEIEFIKIKDGFFPKGGGYAEVITHPASLKRIEVLEKGNLKKIEGISVASSSLEKARVAERQARSAIKHLYTYFEQDPKIKAFYRESLCPGTGITLWAETENSLIGADAIGERSKKSEKVGQEAAEKLIKEYHEGTLDIHLADMLMPYLALFEGGQLKTSRITDHMKTNAIVIEQFLNKKFRFENNTLSCD